MTFRLVDTGWDAVLADAIRADHSCARIVCRFIKKGAARRLLAYGRPQTLQIITRFNLGDFCAGVSDLAAFRLLLENGAVIRGVRNLHVKLYLFGDSRAIVTSANLTEAALLRNHEFGFVAEDTGIVAGCRQYFDDLWAKAKPDLTAARLAKWEQTITKYLATGARPASAKKLRDEGVNAGLAAEPVELPVLVDEAPQAFVKFFGENPTRVTHSMDVFQEVQRSGCHWACTYPKGKRPRQVKDGAIIFMGRMVKEPNDILIYGRAIGMRHVPGRDDATAEDIARRDWKPRWPHYVRVHHAEFVGGTLANGISLNALMDALKSDAFAPTQRNAAKGNGNTNPRRAYRQQASVELTQEANAWLNERLQQAYLQHGRLAPAALEQLDWPAVPVSGDR
jgi:hypothetical protein